MTGPIAFVIAALVAVLLALLGLMLVRRAVPRDRLSQHTDVAGYVYAVIGVVYAVILAQVVVAAWDEYRDARQAAADEAGAVLNLARLAQSWPEPGQTQVEDALRAYGRRVIDVEWPAMARGDFSPSNDTTLLNRLWQTVGAAGSRSTTRSVSYGAALEQLDSLENARRVRVLLGERALPAPMTATLLLGAIITVAFSYLFAVVDRWVHGLMTASLALLVALLLLVEYQLETPYEGISAIPPTAMELVMREFNPDGAGSATQP
jgi:hypothetical protein